MLLEDSKTSRFALKSASADWPSGRIFAHGGNLTFDRLQDALLSGVPTVMLYNTGGVTQTFSSLYTWTVPKESRAAGRTPERGAPGDGRGCEGRARSRRLCCGPPEGPQTYSAPNPAPWPEVPRKFQLETECHGKRKDVQEATLEKVEVAPAALSTEKDKTHWTKLSARRVHLRSRLVQNVTA